MSDITQNIKHILNFYTNLFWKAYEIKILRLWKKIKEVASAGNWTRATHVKGTYPTDYTKSATTSNVHISYAVLGIA